MRPTHYECAALPSELSGRYSCDATHIPRGQFPTPMIRHDTGNNRVHWSVELRARSSRPVALLAQICKAENCVRAVCPTPAADCERHTTQSAAREARYSPHHTICAARVYQNVTDLYGTHPIWLKPAAVAFHCIASIVAASASISVHRASFHMARRPCHPLCSP